MIDICNPVALRAAAEAKLANSSDISPLSGDELLHELQVHQLELQMQNETLRQSQLELEASRDRYIDSYELAPVGFITLNRQGMITAANLTCAALLQVGRLDLLKHRFDAWIVSQDVERWRNHLTGLWQGQNTSSCEVRLKCRDGTTLPVLLSFMGVPEEATPLMHIALTDISERVQTESSLKTSRKLAQDVIDGSTAIIYAADKQGRFILVNKKLLAILNLEKDQLIGNSREKFLPADIAGEHSKNDLTIIKTGVAESFEEHNIEADGMHVYWSQKFPLFDEAGLVTGVCGISTDITEYHHLMKENLDAVIRFKAVLTNAISAIAATLEQRDPYTAGHQRRVAELAAAIGREMGLSADVIEGIYLGGLIHDIGKISVPAEILCKPGHLNEIESALIKEHAEAGYQIVKDIDFFWPVAEMVHQHHERLDGTGYPQQLAGAAIIQEARILGVADVVEAMSANRPYRPGLGIKAALNEITLARGIGLDAAAVDACLRLFNEQSFVFSK